MKIYDSLSKQVKELDKKKLLFIVVDLQFTI